MILRAKDLAACSLALAFCLGATKSNGQGFGFDILGAQNEDFFRPPTALNVRVNPSGSRIVYTRPTYDGERIQVLELASGEEKTIHNPNARDGPITYLAWADDESLIFQNALGDLRINTPSTGFALTVFEAKRTLVFSNAIVDANATLPRMLSVLPDDPEHILISAFDQDGVRRAYRLPLQNWDEDKLPEPLFKKYRDFTTWHAGWDGELELAAKQDSKGRTLYRRVDDSSRWEQMARLLGSELELDLDKHSLLQKRDYLLGVGPGGDSLIFASNKHTDTAALYRYDNAAGGEATLLAHDPTYDLIDLATGMGHVLTSQAKQSWVGIHYQAAKPQTLWLDPSYEALQAEIDALLPTSSNLLTDWDAQEQLIIVSAIWSHRPTESYAYHRTNKTLTRIGAADHPLEKEPGVPSQPISFSGSDGKTIHGYLTPGKSENGERTPLVILVHGGPWARDSWAFDPFTQCLAHNGYSSLRLNFRGSTGYGYEHFVAAAENYGWAVQEDIASARQWAIDNEFADADKVAIMGFSYGGYAAALAAATQKDAFQCAVPISGIYDIVRESRAIKKQAGGGLTHQSWKQMVGSLWNDKQLLRAISPVNLADQISIPLLIAHGRQDAVASVKHAHDFTAALKKSGKSFKYIELEEEGHSLDLPQNQSHLFDEIDAFLAEHLK